MKKRLLLSFMALLTASGMWATEGDVFLANTVEGVEMTFKVISEANKTCQVGEGNYLTSAISNTTSGIITIPAVVKGYSVTSIGDDAFADCGELTHIEIPACITNIGRGAFYCCLKLSSITIPNGVTSIGMSTFAACQNLKSITIPNSVSVIEDKAFADCSSLTSITIPENVVSIGLEVFIGCRRLSRIVVDEDNKQYDSRNDCNAIINSSTNELIVGCMSSFIPDGVISIGDLAFADCIGLTSITLPDGIATIGYGAFSFCRNLIDITIPNEVSNIGDCAFWGCNNLSEITIPDGITKIGENTFASCRSLAEIIIPNSVTTIGGAAFQGCGLYEITIPDGVTSIGDNAFGLCENLIRATIPNSVTSIGEGMFEFCYSLDRITMSNSITSIGNGAFQNCSNLSSITIPNGVISIGDNAFADCNNLTSINIPSSVTTIGNKAFYNCKGLTNITVDEENNNFDSRDNCNAIINSSTNELMVGCKNSFIPDGVISIGDNAFYGHSDLKNVTIPSSVTSIGTNAFYGLKSVTVKNDTPAAAGVKAFVNNSKTVLYVPVGASAVYEGATNWNGFKAYIEIGDGVTRNLTISSAEQGTYCSDVDLDFSGVQGVKAYIASGFIKSTGTVILTRVMDAPAYTGLFVKGAEGNYDIPYAASSSYYVNMLKGNVESVSVNPTEDEYTNYYLSDGTNGLGFYKINSTRTMSANRAILQVPTSLFSANGSRSLHFVFDDEDSTGITSIESITSDDYYDLQGRRVKSTQRGLYIQNGKKVYVK